MIERVRLWYLKEILPYIQIKFPFDERYCDTAKFVLKVRRHPEGYAYFTLWLPCGHAINILNATRNGNVSQAVTDLKRDMLVTDIRRHAQCY